MSLLKFKKMIGEGVNSRLMAGSAVMFIGSMLVSFGNYLYHFLMGRMLGPEDYGSLSSLVSLTYLTGVPINTLAVVVVRHVSFLRSRRRVKLIVYFYEWLRQKFFFFIVIFAFLAILVSGWLRQFLHLESYWPLLIVIAFSGIRIYTALNSAVLRGFTRFDLVSLSGVISVLFKIAMAVLLVSLGWRVLGAISAVLISALLSYFFSTYLVEPFLKKKSQKRNRIKGREIAGFALPVFVSNLAFTSLYTTDIVLARHILPAQESGFYAALATLGKVVYFAASPIILTMFPLAAEKKGRGERSVSLLFQSLGLVFFICLGISLIYKLFPGLMIKLLFGQKYLSAASHLFSFAIFISFHSLASLLVKYFLSQKKVRVVFFPAVAAVFQAGLIFLFPAGLAGVIGISMVISGLLFLSLLLYYWLGTVRTR